MSAEVKKGRVSTRAVRAAKGTKPLVVLTAYTAPMARLADPHVDILLVGDSLGMVVYGLETTLGVTLEMMINHGQAVVRGSQQAMVVIDMPFGSYQESPAQAFHNAARILAETGAQAVKLEGGREVAETITFLERRGIPVMAHVGLKPQSVHALGGFRAQGRTNDEAVGVLADAQSVDLAGAFSVVVEGTWEPVAREITQSISIPTIGIGASVACDGQVLVMEDMLGLSGDVVPKFVKRYGDLGTQAEAAIKAYADDVRARAFPTPAQCYGMI